MECIEARALKSSFRTKTNSQMFFHDDGWGFAGINTVGCDDFPVEDLLNLDFSDKDFEEGSYEEEKGPISYHRKSDSSSTFSGTDEFDSLTVGELAVPVDDLENLEWLSQFVDDTAPELSLLCPSAGSFDVRTGSFPLNRFEPAVQKIRAPCFPVPVPRKTRSKRARVNGRAWPLTSPSLSNTESSSTTSSSYGSTALSPFLFDMDLFSTVEKPPAKKQKKKPASDGGSALGGSQTIRRCTHCQVQKTPQWRAGPLGPKTLCNACGVRYKSGRLFPEYRPACSPTFSQEIHSNSHRKVLEMRRKKETGEVVEPGLSQMVPSC